MASFCRRSARRRVCSLPSSERATSVAPANRSSALKTVAPWRTMKTRVTAADIFVRDAANRNETQCSRECVAGLMIEKLFTSDAELSSFHLLRDHILADWQ